MTGAVALAMMLAATTAPADVSRTLDDGIAAQAHSSLVATSADVRDDYLSSAVRGSVEKVGHTDDDVLAHVIAGSYVTSSGHVQARYEAHLEELRRKEAEEEAKRKSEAEAKAAEEAARVEAERATAQQETSASVGDDVAWLAAHVATGAYDTGEIVMTTGGRIDDSRCMALYALTDATLGSGGAVFSDTEGDDVVCAVLSAVCDATIIGSGDASGGVAELKAHLGASDAFKRVSGAFMPGDVVFWDGGVGIYVGRDAAQEVAAGTSATLLACEPADGRGSYYPWLCAAPSAYESAWRPVKAAGTGVDWRGVVR